MDEHTLNDLLECSVCLERLDTSSKVLPCQHTFCRKCLEVIYSSRQELRCPECRILVEVRIDDLPPNVLLMRILEGMKNAAAAKIQNAQATHKQQQQNDKNKIEETQKLNEEQQQQIKLKQKQLQQYQQQQQQYKHQQISLQQQQQQHATAQQQQRRCLLPHAYALYDSETNEPSDLQFKKGDLLLLKRKIDNNWYVGQLNGVEGIFPINFVKIIVPLPIAQCIALYDFKMGPNEEEGCLTFKKGTVVEVLRRVDHNWAEGRIGVNIGIFPIAFVELNAAAKYLLDAVTMPQSSNVCAQTAHQQQQRILPPIPMLDPTINAHASDSTTTTSSSSSAASSNTTSPHSNATVTSSSNSSCNNSMPNSPLQSLSNTPQHTVSNNLTNNNNASSNIRHNSVRYRDGREKRHSLNALLTGGNAAATPALSLLQANRHSAEILNVPSEFTASASTSTAAIAQTTVAREQQHDSMPTGCSTRVNVLKTGGQQLAPPTLPWGYLALYPYKPRKNDELELKKGCVYVVTERCLDGWFKGKNWQDISGVFPGNYVTPLRSRDQQQLTHQRKYVPLQQNANELTAAIATTNNAHGSNVGLTHLPPDLPPRHLASNATASAAAAACSNVWTKPLSQTVEAFFNRSSIKSAATTYSEQQRDTKDKDTTTATSAAVGLMKRLAAMKTRSKSPAASATANTTINYSMDNPTFEDATAMPTTMHVQTGTAHLSTTHAAQMHPVHVRSGSCPSQLLQSLPPTTTQMTENMQQHNAAAYGSQRIKSNKERPALQTARQTGDANARSIYNNPPTTSLQHFESALIKCSPQHQQQQQQRQQPNVNNADIQHRKTQSFDANSTLVSSTNATPCHISAAAIAASATTKSTQNTHECRFRCVIPYPPNSDFELELQVGDIIYVQRKQKNGWYKGTHARTNKTGLFPATFVEPDI